MRWITISAALASVALGQPELRRALEHATTPQQVIRIVHDWQGGLPMSLHSARWNNGEVLGGDMVATFDRDTATYDLDDQTHEADAVSSGVDTRRYGGDLVICGAPTIQQLISSANSIKLYGAGRDSDGNTIVCFFHGTTPPVFVVAQGGSSFTTLNSKTLTGGPNKPSATDWDILSGEDDEETDYAHAPRSVVCLDGIILIPCCSIKYAGSGSRTDEANWSPDGVSLVYSIDNGATYRLAWRTGSLVSGSPPSDFGSEWSRTCTQLARDGSADDFWITVASYASGSNRTADTLVCHVTGGSGNWSISKAHRKNHTVGPSNTTHVHWSAVFADPANSGGLKQIAEIGDGQADNRTEEWLCSSAESFLVGASDMSGALNVVEGGSNWTGPTAINGRYDPDGAGAEVGYMSAQTISCAPGPNGGFYAGADEGGASSIMYATVPATNGARIQWQHAYGFGGNMLGGQSGANPNEINWRVFTLNSWDYAASNPAVCGLIAPGNQWPTGYEEIIRVVYKAPDDDAFGVVYAPQNETGSVEQIRPVIAPDGFIYLGSGNGNGLRRFVAPPSSARRKTKALFTGPGGVNLALATPVQVSAPGSGNTMTIGTETAPSQPPTTAAVMHATAGTAAAGMGAYRITADAMSKTHSVLLVQVLVYTDTDPADIDASTYWRGRCYTVEGTTSLATGFRGPMRMEVRGHYTLLTYQFKNGAGADDDWDLSGLTAPLQLVFQQQMAGASIEPGEWWQEVVGVYEDPACPPSYFVPPATTGDGETMQLSGFTAGSAWTAYLVGELGGTTGRDCRYHNAGTHRALATLWESASKYLEITWDANGEIILGTADGVGTDTETITGLPLPVRGDPFILAIACDGTDYRYALTVSGTETQSGTIAAANAIINPTKILLGQNNDGSALEATRWAYAAIDDANALTSNQLAGFVRSMSPVSLSAGKPGSGLGLILDH